MQDTNSETDARLVQFHVFWDVSVVGRVVSDVSQDLVS